ncbi:Male-specific lethal 3-like [Oopsacas minuta]|uniref:Male-specific lethal 3-like n=1 Tax=Oopsacas minuta TaxID=111878 RepID=A0AAV7KBL9_9METZ|nr:Male-specific lethal 3-like [Oopsacas minuta]
MASGTRGRKQLGQSEQEIIAEPVKQKITESENLSEEENKYKIGDKVLCYEPDPTKAKVLYNSRVLDLREKGKKKGMEDKKLQYLMHFVGWSNNWDCWVEENSIIADDPTGREIQKRANRVANRSLKKDEMSRNRGVVTRGKKRQRKFHDSDEDSDNEHVTSTRYSSKDSEVSEISESECSTSTCTEPCQPKSKPQGKASQMPEHIIFNLPAALKAVLMEDMNQYQLGLQLRLPRSPNVREILLLYLQQKIQDSPEQEGIYGEIVDGIKIYFDFLVGDQLLYESELPQFKRFFPQSRNKPLLIACSPDYVKYAPITKIECVVNKDRPTNSTSQGIFLKPPASKPQKDKDSHMLPSQVYGVEHLARLFVHLPDFMGKADIPRKHNLLISSHLQDLIDNITSNLPRYQETAQYEEPIHQNQQK